MIDGMTSLINIHKIMQLSKMIDGMTSLINILETAIELV